MRLNQFQQFVLIYMIMIVIQWADQESCYLK
jgi:hypothetical protein